MPTTPPAIKQLLSCCAISLCLVAALLLAACSPGTGGTGTGPTVSASPTTSTTSYFTGAGAPAAAPSLPAPTCTVACPANPAPQAINLQVQPERIELSTPCATFTYAGTWTLSATGEATVQGVWESTTTVNGQSTRSSQSASLTLVFPSGLEGSTVSVSIKDSTGQLLLGPVTLQRTPSAPVNVSSPGC